MYEKIEYYLKHHYRCFCRCIYWAWRLCYLELQNSTRTICYAICTLVHKHFGVWSIYHCCVADLLCDKSNHQAQAEKEVSQFQLVIYKRRFNSLRFSFMMKEVGLTEFPIGTPRPTTNVSAILHHSAFDLAGWDRMLLPFNAPI